MRIRYQDAGTSGAHSDFFQCYDPNDTVRNVTLYNVRNYQMAAQGLFGCEANGYLEDIALVNVLLEKNVGTINDPPFSQMGYWLHTLLWHVTTVNQYLTLRGGSNTFNHFDVRDGNWCVFSSSPATDTTLPYSVIEYNHFANLMWDQPKPMGTHVTRGDPKFADTTHDDYHVTSASPCWQSGTPLPGVPADIDGNLYDPAHPDRGAFSSYQVGVRDRSRAEPNLSGCRVALEGNPPLSRALGIRLKLDGAQDVRVSILDTRGHVRRELYHGVLAGGSLRLDWDGRDSQGRILPENVYYVQVATGAGAIIRPLVALRVSR